jgi:uncharacterized DUF497 family protein
MSGPLVSNRIKVTAPGEAVNPPHSGFPFALTSNCVKTQFSRDRGQDMDLRDALIDWDEPDDEGSNTAHIGEHGLTPEEVESALFDDRTTFDVSDSSDRPIAFGKTERGRFIVVVFEVLNLADPLVIRPITAYDVPEPTE